MTSLPDPFIISRDRDAAPAIRGLVFQVELTILRWLALAPNDILELERGEDIDLIARSIVADEIEASRLLEQVKHRETRMSLRTGAAREALANFFEHRRANAGMLFGSWSTVPVAAAGGFGLSAVTLVACAIPAVRATAISPASALRSE
jgi:hypothetical protein